MSPERDMAPRGEFMVTAKLPEQDGEFEYRIRSAIEEHERTVRESQLTVIEAKR